MSVYVNLNSVDISLWGFMCTFGYVSLNVFECICSWDRQTDGVAPVSLWAVTKTYLHYHIPPPRGDISRFLVCELSSLQNADVLWNIWSVPGFSKHWTSVTLSKPSSKGYIPQDGFDETDEIFKQFLHIHETLWECWHPGCLNAALPVGNVGQW